MGIVLPDSVQDPVTDDFITTAWGDAVNTAIAYIATNRPHATVYNSALQSLTNNTVTAITFDSERADVGSLHSTSSNTSRLTITDPGWYLITGNLEYAGNATGQRQARIRLNGTTAIALVNQAGSTAGNDIVVTCFYPLVAGDYVELCGFQDSGGNLNVSQSNNYSPQFSCAWMTT